MSSTTTSHDNTGLIAGIGGAAALVIAGGAFALGRRKREDEEEPVVYETAEPVGLVEEPAPVVRAAAPLTPPIVETDPLAENGLPEGFDLSRFGPHTQAAYRGPTADNPFLSLKKRLHRAAFYDKRLRESGEMPETVATQSEAVAPSRTQSILGSKLGDRLNFKPARGGRVSFKPATA